MNLPVATAAVAAYVAIEGKAWPNDRREAIAPAMDPLRTSEPEASEVTAPVTAPNAVALAANLATSPIQSKRDVFSSDAFLISSMATNNVPSADVAVVTTGEIVPAACERPESPLTKKSAAPVDSDAALVRIPNDA